MEKDVHDLCKLPWQFYTCPLSSPREVLAQDCVSHLHLPLPLCLRTSKGAGAGPCDTRGTGIPNQALGNAAHL